MQDDPKAVHGLVFAYAPTIVTFAGWPIIAILSFAGTLVLVRRKRNLVWLLPVMMGLCVALYCLLNWDPGDVVEWLMD